MAKVIQIQVIEAAGAKAAPGAKISVSGSSTEQVTNQDGVAQLLLDEGDVTIQINGALAYKGGERLAA
jgi:hypothetical protein